MNDLRVLGVDGGGTKTVCIVINAQRQVLGQCQTGSTNRNSVGNLVAKENLARAIRGALAHAGCSGSDIDAICLGMSGVGRPDDRHLVQQWVDGLLPNVRTLIYNDAVAALASGTNGRLFGVVVISGTGMIVYGVDAQGCTARAGGWGALLGDPGGGYAIGAAILRAVTAAVDGYGPATILEDAVLKALSLSRPSELITWAYRDVSWERFAMLAPLASQCAQQGDAVAHRIIEQASFDLSLAAHAVVRNLQLENIFFPLVLAGGNLAPGLLAEKVRHHLRTRIPHANVVFPLVTPAMGAAFLALNKSSEHNYATTQGLHLVDPLSDSLD